jgi:hypothetical protein
MLRSMASKVAWMARGTTTVVGLAIMLAMMFGVASAAFGANGGSFILGQLNKATSMTRLTANVAGDPALQVTNNNPAAGSRALHLNAFSGRAPLTVNETAGRATNLNADKVDGSEGEMWAQINENGTADNWKGMTGNSRFAEGVYIISFARDVRAAISTSIASHGAPHFPGSITATTTDNVPNAVTIFSYDSSGEVADRDFHLVLFCGDHQSA